jgi:hypothetical protein
MSHPLCRVLVVSNALCAPSVIRSNSSPYAHAAYGPVLHGALGGRHPAYGRATALDTVAEVLRWVATE